MTRSSCRTRHGPAQVREFARTRFGPPAAIRHGMQLFTRVSVGVSILGVSALAGIGAYVVARPTPVRAIAPELAITTIEPETFVTRQTVIDDQPHAYADEQFAFVITIDNAR